MFPFVPCVFGLILESLVVLPSCGECPFVGQCVGDWTWLFPIVSQFFIVLESIYFLILFLCITSVVPRYETQKQPYVQSLARTTMQMQDSNTFSRHLHNFEDSKKFLRHLQSGTLVSFQCASALSRNYIPLACYCPLFHWIMSSSNHFSGKSCIQKSFPLAW